MTSIDALGAFSHLQSNLPSWITRVSNLAAHASIKHAEYSAAYRRHATHKSRRRKNSSICSIRTTDVEPIAQRPSPMTESTDTVAPAEHEPATPLQTAGRKRSAEQTPSIESDDRYDFVSTRHNVIIEYDGHIQKSLEEIVRDIGIARNHLRRGKMSMVTRRSPRFGLRHQTSLEGVQTAENESPLSSLSFVRSTRAGSGLPSMNGSMNGSAAIAKESSFDFAEKQLELAHSLCETAAYQVLRSGDCGTELDGVEEKFKILFEMAEREVKRLEEEKRQQEEEVTLELKSTQKSVEEDGPIKPLTPTAARLARLAAIAASKPTTTAPDTIEVDDASSISVESIDLSAFRASRIRI
ncbi:Uncharacterized protein PECH_001394 [Penicillium ucsense]|uniref:Uncharacterized protein n=1 Tax=Penicillium ucsense TaxID=2839758 RepID=A0A8J8WLP6_9EURO|nr:Uncharacterized protein PECM_003481 [Penicillium ucsense]KAF7738171.1 Uncharacterized protein PECH_001394 [Penicillium ucsense]